MILQILKVKYVIYIFVLDLIFIILGPFLQIVICVGLILITKMLKLP